MIEGSEATTRRRLTRVLFAGVAMATTGYIAAITVATLAARTILGSADLAGLPSAVAVIGTAGGTALWGQLAPTRGRRFGLVAGFLSAATGAAISTVAVLTESFPLLLAGMAVLGFGQSSSHLARYAAADLAPAERRGRAVSFIVWAGTVGAVIGPRLLEPAGSLSERAFGAPYAGGYLATSVFMAASALVYWGLLRPEPNTVAVAEGVEGTPADSKIRPRSVLAHPGVQLAAIALVIGQAVMVLIMTATPVHIENTGFGLGVVGSIISAHTLGMFAFSPITGRLTDLLGPVRVIAAGAVMLLVAALMAAGAPDGANVMLGWGLFLLGLGWNFGFVAGSALLTSSVDRASRPVIQGRVDAAVWSASALASASSGLVLAGPGYRSLGIIGGGLVAVMVVALATRGRQVGGQMA